MSDETAPGSEPESTDDHDVPHRPMVGIDGDIIDHPSTDAGSEGPGSEGPGSEGEAGAAMTVEELIETVETVTAERDAHLADLQRVTADFANFRRQVEKRQADIVHQAAARLAEELLPVLDAFDAAEQQGVEGIDHVHQQLLAILQREGLEVLAEEGETFDPQRHEAAMTEPGEGGSDGPVVAQVLRTGYGWKGRVLRAAMVAVRG